MVFSVYLSLLHSFLHVGFCDAAVQKIIEVFSSENDEFKEFPYNMKVYRQATCFRFVLIQSLPVSHFQNDVITLYYLPINFLGMSHNY